MEVETGKIRAISNFGRTDDGKYYEKLNYSIGEAFLQILDMLDI